MLNVVTLLVTKHGTTPDALHGERSFWRERGVEYVEKFWAGFRRHCAEPFNGFLLTDTPEATVAGITPLLLPPKAGPGWWAKLAVFKKGMLPPGVPTLYSDLDNVICGPLAPLFAIPTAGHELFMCDDIIYPGMPNGGLMCGRFDKLSYLWNDYQVDPKGTRLMYSRWPHASDQAFTSDRVHARSGSPVPLLQNVLPPRFILNATAHLERGAPWNQGTSILVGGHAPKPHLSTNAFYAEHWRT